MKHVKRFLALWAVLTVVMYLSGCVANWASEASSIIGVLIPAIGALLATLTQIGVPEETVTAFQQWSKTSQTSLSDVQALIASYNTAEASAQPGIIGQIDSSLSAVLNQFNSILATVKVSDPKTVQLWTSLATDFTQEVEALLNLVPVIKGQVTAHDEVVSRLTKLKSAKSFKNDFNKKLVAGGFEAHKI
jgi:hypothetical protein